MNLYWLYDLPNWIFCLITVGFFMVIGIGGTYYSRAWVRRLHKVDHSHNDIVGIFLAAVTVFYGITLGLVTIGTWDTYSSVENKVDAEAQIIASLYRDVGSYPEPFKSELRKDLKDYTAEVINVSWPQQRKGIVPSGSGKFLDDFQNHLVSFNPTSIAHEVLQAEVFKQYNVLVEIRRARLNSVNAGLPSSLWMLIISGAIITIGIAMFFDTASFRMHVIMMVFLSILIGLIVFLVGTLDNPFRGSVSVKPEPLELVNKQLMSGNKDIK